MSAECPNGHGFKCIVANITVDGQPPVKNEDVIAHKLACGCVVGGPDFEEFQNQVLEIRNAEKIAIATEKEKARKALGAAFRAYHDNKED